MIHSLIDHLRRLPSEWRGLLLAAVAIAILLTPHYGMSLEDPPLEDHVVGLEPWMASGFSQTGKWKAGTFRAEDANAHLDHALPAEPWKRVELTLIGPPGSWSVRIGRGFQGRLYPRVQPGDKLVIEAADFPGDPISPEPFLVSVRSEGPGELRRVNIRATILGTEDKLPSLPGLLLTPFLPLGLALFLTSGGRRTVRSAALIATVAGLVAAIGSRFNPTLLDPASTITAALFLASGIGMAMRARGDRPTLWRAELLFVLGILALAMVQRWNALSDQLAVPLRPDAVGYVQIAREGSFYSTSQSHAPWIREPLFPALLRGWFLLAPDTNTGARLFSFLLSLLPVVLLWLAGRKLFGPIAALLAAGMVALNPFFVQLSTEVLRDDLLHALLLGFLAAYVLIDRPWKRALAVGLIGAGLVLTRINFLFLLPILVVGLGLRSKWHWGEILTAALIATLPALPHLAYNARVGNGDWLYSSNVHIRYYANLDHLGEPGFPEDKNAWNADPYHGGTMAFGGLLALYAPSEVIAKFLRGFVALFAYDYPHATLFAGREIPMLFGLLGLWTWWERRREIWWLLPFFGLVMLPVAFVVTIHLDHRLAIPATGLILWTWGAGVDLAMQKAWSAMQGRGAA